MKINHYQLLAGSLFVIALNLMPSVSAAHTDLSAAEAHDMILADSSLVVVDVREYAEFCGANEHIEGAVNLPWTSGVFQVRFDDLPFDAHILVVCAAGGRSNAAANFLDGEGYTDVYDMLGGMGAWLWEREACGADPLLRPFKLSGEPKLNWNPPQLFDYYDLLRGSLEDVYEDAGFIDVGSITCLVEDSPYIFATDIDPPLPGGIIFYLARRSDDECGFSSSGLPRVPSTSNCP